MKAKKTSNIEQRTSNIERQTAAAPVRPQLQEVARDSIMPSPTNPRKFFAEDKLAELADSIRQLGIQQPLIVRPLPKYALHEPDMISKTWRIVRDIDGGCMEIIKEFPKPAQHEAEQAFAEMSRFEYELIAGERRWRAAGLAEMDRVPALISRLTDAQALEIQYIENLQRQDLTPVEEAEGFRALLDAGTYTVPTLCAKLGIKRSTIFARLSLLKLSEPVQTALREGRIPHTIAELIGRIPGETLQAKALEEIEEGGREFWSESENKYLQEPMSFREAKEYIENEFQVDLNEARFDLHRVYDLAPREDDALPINEVGSCNDCPRRSGNARDEFPDIKSPNVCTDPACFKAKTLAHRAAEIEQVRASGARFLTEEEVQESFYANSTMLNGRADYVVPSEICDDDEEQRTFEQLLGDQAPEPVYAVRNGVLVTLYEKAAVKPLLKKHGVNLEAEREGDYAKERAKEQAERKAKQAVAARAIHEIRCQERGKMKTDIAFWRWLASDLCYSAEILELLNVDRNKGNVREAFAGVLSSMGEGELRALIVLARQCNHPVDWQGNWTEAFQEVCKAYGVDLAAIEEELNNKDAKSAKKGKKK